MRKLIYGMNVSVDGYIAAPGDNLEWSAPTPETFRWWLQREQAVSVFLYGRRLWETMSSYWPTGDEQPDASPDHVAFARTWRDKPKVVFSSTLASADWNASVFRGDAVAEIERLKHGDGGPMRVGGASIGGAALRAGLVDEIEVMTHPVLLGSGARFFPPLDAWVHLAVLSTEHLPGGVSATRYAVQRAEGAR